MPIILIAIVIAFFLIRSLVRAARRPALGGPARPAIPTGAQQMPSVYRTKYRTKDGLADYEFSFERQAGGDYLAYIINMPSYRQRDQGLRTTHRLSNGNRYYVCWSTQIWNLQDLQQVVALWSDLTQVYIRTGQTIDDQILNGATP